MRTCHGLAKGSPAADHLCVCCGSLVPMIALPAIVSMHSRLPLPIAPTLLLCRWSLTHPPAVTVEDFSALTSSQQLTRIDLAYRVAPNHSAGVFQGQRQLSNLHFLSLGISWVADLEAMERMVTCCPNLRRLKIDSYGATEDGDDVAGIDPSFWEEGFASLTRLSALTKLALLSIDVSMQPEVFAAIAGLTGLRELTCEYLDATELGSMMQLTTLRQLTKFTVDALQLGHPLGDDHERRLELCVQNKVRHIEDVTWHWHYTSTCCAGACCCSRC